MIVYRIAKKQFLNDLEGTGARIAGGRWNSKGRAIVYTSSSISLAMLEVLVHLPVSILPPAMGIAEIMIPEELKIHKIKVASLATNWRDFPSPDHLKTIGDRWVEDLKSPLLQVHSAVNPEEFNYLINPFHHESQRIKIISLKDLSIDGRLL